MNQQQLEMLSKYQLIQMLLQKNTTNILQISNTYTSSFVQGDVKSYNIEGSTIHGDLKVGNDEMQTPEPILTGRPTFSKSIGKQNVDIFIIYLI